jgi:homogentisate 1,2-dioxygenase
VGWTQKLTTLPLDTVGWTQKLTTLPLDTVGWTQRLTNPPLDTVGWTQKLTTLPLDTVGWTQKLTTLPLDTVGWTQKLTNPPCGLDSSTPSCRHYTIIMWAGDSKTAVSQDLATQKRQATSKDWAAECHSLQLQDLGKPLHHKVSEP